MSRRSPEDRRTLAVAGLHRSGTAQLHTWPAPDPTFGRIAEFAGPDDALVRPELPPDVDGRRFARTAHDVTAITEVPL